MRKQQWDQYIEIPLASSIVKRISRDISRKRRQKFMNRRFRVMPDELGITKQEHRRLGRELPL